MLWDNDYDDVDADEDDAFEESMVADDRIRIHANESHYLLQNLLFEICRSSQLRLSAIELLVVGNLSI